jgi:hypothetical protein
VSDILATVAETVALSAFTESTLIKSNKRLMINIFLVTLFFGKNNSQYNKCN